MYVTSKGNRWFDDKEWLTNTDKRIRQSAVKEFVGNYKSMVSNAFNNGRSVTLRTRFKKKKNEAWVMRTESTTFEKVTKKSFWLCKSRMTDAIKTYERLPDYPLKDFGILKDKWGDYYLLYSFSKKEQRIQKKRPAISADGGIKKFLTCYTTDKNIYEYVDSKEDDLLTIFNKISKIQSALDRGVIKGKRKQYSKEIIKKLWKQIDNKIKDMHWKVIKDMTDNYNWIIIGKLYIKSILQQSTIAKLTKQRLSMLSHYAFKQRLQYKCNLKGVKFSLWSEWGTTKGCPCCGHHNKTITLSDREFHCPECNYSAERDAKAACCIALKCMTKTW